MGPGHLAQAWEASGAAGLAVALPMEPRGIGVLPHPCPELLWGSPCPLVSDTMSRVVSLAFREHPIEHPTGERSVAATPVWFGAGLPSQSPSRGILLFPPAQARCSHPPAKAQSELVPSSQDLLAEGHPCVGGWVPEHPSCQGMGGFAGIPQPRAEPPLSPAIHIPPSLGEQECDGHGESSTGSRAFANCIRVHG